MQLSTRGELLRASPPLFASRRLDRLTRVHWWGPVAVFGPLIVALAVLSLERLHWPMLVGMVLGGYAFWTLCEYWVHRSVFHLHPKSDTGVRIHWMIHGVHHDHPNDPLRLVLPPVLSVPLGVAFFGLFYLVLGLPHAWGFGVGFFAGYLAYDMTHYFLHHARPKSRLGKRLRELHMRHHFEDENRGYGVSAPWWDLVFGTYSRRTAGSDRRSMLAVPSFVRTIRKLVRRRCDRLEPSR